MKELPRRFKLKLTCFGVEMVYNFCWSDKGVYYCWWTDALGTHRNEIQHTEDIMSYLKTGWTLEEV